MKIEKIIIKNFRPVGEEALELTLANNCTTIIGENNVGKSSILEAVKHILQNTNWDVEDWNGGDQNKTLEISLECTLDDDQIEQIIKVLNLPLTVTKYRNNFTDKLTYQLRRTLNQSFSLFSLGELYIEYNTGWIGKINRQADFSFVKWDAIITQITLQKDKNAFEIIKEIMDRSRQHQSTARIDFGRNVSDDLLKILKESIIVIEEFREKPQKTLNDFVTSPTGKELASVLFNLKNARPEQSKKFEQIRDKFHQLFPTLELDVIREIGKNEIKILIQKAGIESTTYFIGAGILESLLMLTHLIAHNEKVLCIDHPELHLHPHAQRRLAFFIQESINSQIILVTHSPYFASLKEKSGIIRIVRRNHKIEVIKPSQNYFTDEDFSKLEQFLDIDTKELFFAGKALLVEGQTELGALPIFATRIDYDFDENGVSIINVGGKKGFEIFVKLCEGFKIPYFIVADNDASPIITKIKAKYPNCKSRILPSKFDNILPIEVRKEARRFVGNSKPRIGKYAARKMLERDYEIPKEIKQIIEEVKKL